MSIVANQELIDLADITGLVVDRTVVPELVLGQGCLMPDGCLVTLASAVFNYSKATAALAVRFPHPQLSYSVSTIKLHPGFNRRAALLHYLSQTGLSSDRPLTTSFDMAQLELQPEAEAPAPEDWSALTMALSVPLARYGEGQTGTYSADDIPQIVQTFLAEGTGGLLTLLNERNKPVAYLGIGEGKRGRLERIAYKNLTRNMALFELLYRRPNGTYLFQPAAAFPGPQMQEMSTPFDGMAAEGLRRASEIAEIIDDLRGLDGRYVRTERDFVPEDLPYNARAQANKLARVLDGYITLDNLSERTDIDTYQALRAVREMVGNGLLERREDSPFHAGGKLGTALELVSANALNAGDQVTGFYLDTLSGKPCLVRGELRGPATGQDPTRLLHSLPLPGTLQGALVLAGSQLAGIHTGPHQPDASEPEPQASHEMISIDAYETVGQTRAFRMATHEMVIPLELREKQAEKPAQQEGETKSPESSPAQANEAEKAQGDEAGPQAQIAEPATPPVVALPEPTQFDIDPGITENPLVIPGAASAGRTIPTRDLLDLADVVGLVTDRTLSPELVLGQGCLTDRNRLTICASHVFRYVKTPWALAARFPSANRTLGVKAITLHPDFNTRYAQMQYLAQSGGPTDRITVIPNDLAVLTLEPDLQQVDADKLNELESILSRPLSELEDASLGKYTGGDLAHMLKEMLTAGKPGLLTLLDTRNAPIAYIGISNGSQSGFTKTFYKGLVKHLAIFELLYRQPQGTYLFQNSQEFPWPDIREIEGAGDVLLSEAERGSAGAAELMKALGGPDARYVKAQEQFIRERIQPNTRWVAERLWAVLDGFITLDKLWQRTQADTYHCLRGLDELVRQDFATKVSDPPFKDRNQIGLPLLPVHIESLSIGDPLAGFFLDPLTGRPCKLHGDFLGTAGDADCLLHSVPFPESMQGALLVVDNQLLGLNAGPHVSPQGEASGDPLGELICVDALREFKPRRQKPGVTRDMKVDSGADQAQAKSTPNLPAQRTPVGSGQHIPAAPEPPPPEPVIPLEKKPGILNRQTAVTAGSIAASLVLIAGLAVFLGKSGGGQISPAEIAAIENRAREDAGKKASSSHPDTTAGAPSAVPGNVTLPIHRKHGTIHKALPSEITAYAEAVDQFMKSNYKPLEGVKPEEVKAVIQVGILYSGQACGFTLLQSTGNANIDRRLTNMAMAQTYPPAPHVPMTGVVVNLNIDGSKIDVSLPKPSQ